MKRNNPYVLESEDVQLITNPHMTTPTLTTCLWFDHEALDAANHYISVFADSSLGDIEYYNEPNPYVPDSKAGDVWFVEFVVMGSKFFGLNGGSYFKLSPAVSFMIPCKDQQELDHYYEKLSAKVEAEQCGWIEDKFGVSWQLIPANFTDYMKSGDSVKKARLMKAILDLKRLSWDAIDQAYNS